MARGKRATEEGDIEVVENQIEETPSETKEPARGKLKRFIEPLMYKVDEKTGITTTTKFSIEGRPVTFIGSRPKHDRKCLWDKVIPGDEASEDIPLDNYKEIPGYDAVYVRTRFTNMNKRTMDVFLVKTPDELQLYQIDE